MALCIQEIKVFERDCKNTGNPTDAKPVSVSYDFKIITACAALLGRNLFTGQRGARINKRKMLISGQCE